jgi:hypothetical protein
MVVLAFALMTMITGQTAAQTTNTFPSSGNVGIGTTSPVNALDVGTASVGTFQGTAMAVSSNNGISTVGVGQSQTARGRLKWHYNATEASSFMSLSVSGGLQPLVLQDAGGNVGIGTTAPASLLDLRKDASGAAGPIFTLSNITGGTGAGGAIDFSNPGLGVPQQAQIRSSDNNDWSANLLFLTKVPGAGTNALAERMRISSNGNVGIGTTSPGGPIDIRDSSGRQLLWNMSGAGHTFLNANGGNVHVAANLYFNGTNWNRYNTGAAGGMWWAASDGTLGVLQVGAGANPVAAFSQPLFINTSGYVGLGTNTPTFKLDVQNGAVNASGGLCIAGDCKTAWSQVGGGSSQWTTAGSNISYSSGNVGIGIASPPVYAALDVNTSNNKSIHTMDSTNGGLLIGYSGSTIQARETNDGNNKNLLLQNWGGNVGIGTTSPTEKLHVSGNGKFTGNLTVDGNIAAKYQDVAEWVPSSEQLSAGTVVVLDSTKSNQVISSSQAYDTRVAGVISEQPGIALGESGDGKVLVATAGRVRVKVDASRAPIHIGDLLVTSDVAGVAMKSEAVNLGGVQLHRPGTLIGKALEPLAKGTGTILVLLSLQ